MPSAEPVKPAGAAEKVAAWNPKHLIDTKMNCSSLDCKKLETTSEAVVLLVHRAAVHLKGHNGYFDSKGWQQRD